MSSTRKTHKKSSKLAGSKSKEPNPKIRPQAAPVPSKPPRYPPNTQGQRIWLVKSEPLPRIVDGRNVSFSLESLLNEDSEPWTGVRNFEARNNLLHMKENDICFFYHSNCKIPGIVGIATVKEEASPDPEQFRSGSPYFDKSSSKDKPKWWCPSIKFHRRLRHKIPYSRLCDEGLKNPVLAEMVLVKRSRLSVSPVSVEQYKAILDLESQGEIVDDIDCDISQDLINPIDSDIKHSK